MRALGLVVVVSLAACQTRHQATVVAAGAGGIAVIGGYAEYESGARPLSAVLAGSIAFVSAVSILFLDEHRRTLGDRSGGWQPPGGNGKSELLAGIRRTSCFGTCPAYRVAIFRDGEIWYQGDAYVAKRGAATGHLSQDKVRDLERILRHVDAAALDGAYLEEDETDMPTVNVWYRPRGGPTAFIEHYHGDHSAPAQLAAIEDAIDRAIDVEQWIGPRDSTYTACIESISTSMVECGR